MMEKQGIQVRSQRASPFRPIDATFPTGNSIALPSNGVWSHSIQPPSEVDTPPQPKSGLSVELNRSATVRVHCTRDRKPVVAAMPADPPSVPTVSMVPLRAE